MHVETTQRDIRHLQFSILNCYMFITRASCGDRKKIEMKTHVRNSWKCKWILVAITVLGTNIYAYIHRDFFFIVCKWCCFFRRQLCPNLHLSFSRFIFHVWSALRAMVNGIQKIVKSRWKLHLLMPRTGVEKSRGCAFYWFNLHGQMCKLDRMWH